VKPLLILGTGNFAVEVADLVSDMDGFRVTGFVQNVDPQNTQARLEGLPVLWVEEVRALSATDWAVCAIGAVERRGFIEQVAGFGFRFATLVHPTARVSATSRLGEGTIVSAGAVIAAHTQVGRHVIVNRGVLIGHHTAIGDYATLGPGANIAGSVAIGEATLVGIGATVSDHLTIGKRCFLSAGAVVTGNVGDNIRVVTANTRVFLRNPE
jgi:sugar O-acyltransferase (sialic acid O-acetyltransferase NeuD family)